MQQNVNDDAHESITTNKIVPEPCLIPMESMETSTEPMKPLEPLEFIDNYDDNNENLMNSNNKLTLFWLRIKAFYNGIIYKIYLLLTPKQVKTPSEIQFNKPIFISINNTITSYTVEYRKYSIPLNQILFTMLLHTNTCLLWKKMLERQFALMYTEQEPLRIYP
jgi:hypothetical protein